MYQDVLDALNACKTTRQHFNAMEKLLTQSAADPRLQALIADYASVLNGKLRSLEKQANQKTFVKGQREFNVARAKAERAIKFVPSAPQPDGTVPPTVTALLAYCRSKI